LSESLSFAGYRGAPRPALGGGEAGGLCLVVPAYTTLALVGESGCGKSTLGRLLLRLADPAAGRVLVGGADLRGLDALAHRGRLGVVPQEPQLFDRSLADNVAYGLEPPPPREAVVAACEVAGVGRFVDRLPRGYDTAAGERAARLSGGEKQRVALARALVRDPRVLLLDEATSALDAASERLVQAALDRAAVGRTTLVIAHRLATVRRADAIAVIADGAVAELGSHGDLVRRDGAYAAMVRAQAGAEDATLSDYPSDLSERSAPSEVTVDDLDDDDPEWF